MRTPDFSFLDKENLPPAGPQLMHRLEADDWPTNDSTYNDYLFQGHRGNLHNLRQTIAERLGGLTAGVGMDIAGGRNGIAVQDMLRLGLIKHGIVTNYLDKRDEATRALQNLTHIDGDLTKRPTWENIFDTVEQVAPEGLSIVTCFPGSGLEDMPTYFYEGGAHAALDMLRPGGVYLGSIPLGLQLYDEMSAVGERIRARPDVERLRSGFDSIIGTVLILKNL